jgi:hypothetical protein
MKKGAAPKQTYTVTQVNKILSVVESVSQIRQQYPEQNRMKVLGVVHGDSLYKFRVLRGERLRLIGLEPAPEKILKKLAGLTKRRGRTPAK